MNRVLGLVVILVSGFAMMASRQALAQQARLKDLVNIVGVRENQLWGYGIVTGLAGTGDSAASINSRDAISHMLRNMGIDSAPEKLISGNFAAVYATAELPAFARNGDRVSVRLSAIGDASSLAGGTLAMTNLEAGDKQVYVAAQGPVVVGQANGVGSSVLTVATVPLGGFVEREFLPKLAETGKITLSLKHTDFTTNARIKQAINLYFKGFYAKSTNPRSVEVTIPAPFKKRLVEFVAELESLKVKVDRKAIVVLNERTGTVVMGDDVTIGPVTIAHGQLSLKVSGNNDDGEISEQENALIKMKNPFVSDIVKDLNRLGVKPADLVGILEAIDSAGALQGELRFK